MTTILNKFGLDSSTFDRYCIEQKLPDRSRNYFFSSFIYFMIIEILIPDHSNVFYALVRSSDDKQVELIVREKTQQELQTKTNSSLINTEYNRMSSGLSVSSVHSG